MKKIILSAVILSLGLTGCMNTYNLTEEEAGIITEYASSVVLKHDMTYAEELTDAGKPKEKAPSTEENSTATADGKKENTSTGKTETTSSNGTAGEENIPKEAKAASLTKVIGKSGFTVKYNSYALYDTYPKNAKDSGYLVSAPKNGKLLIAELTVKNTTGAKKSFNSMDEKWEITLDSGKNDVLVVSYYPTVTFLPNSLQYAKMSVDAGKSKKVVVVFEVPAKGDYNKYTLTIKNGGLMSANKLK